MEVLLWKRKIEKQELLEMESGTLYRSEALQLWIYQYYEPSGKRKTIKQRKKESVREFKSRVTELKSKLNNNTYIEKKEDSIDSIINAHIKQKLLDRITNGRAYNRDVFTLEQLRKCCSDFIFKPIQKVSLSDIQKSKENMKQYAQSSIDKMWRLLKKSFAIASSPSVRLIDFNIMIDENLRKPLSNKKTKKVLPLSQKERKRFLEVLNNEEKNHKYRNIVKLEWLTAMRIGEVLARTKDDIDKNKTKLHIHNTLTEDENQNVIIGEHTKTYNKSTRNDDGERFFPISKEIKQIIDEELSKKVTNIHNLLFWDYEKNTFISDSEINAWLRRINEKYHICEETLHNHRLRHDRITQWKECGMDMSAIQYLVGHVEGSSITSDVYIDISQDFAFKQYEKVK